VDHYLTKVVSIHNEEVSDIFVIFKLHIYSERLSKEYSETHFLFLLIYVCIKEEYKEHDKIMKH
jgi:hypothetical protein